VDRLVAWRTGQVDGEVRAAALLDEVQVRELNHVLAALEGSGADPLVFKGAALAHTHYEASWLRPRLDADLLIPEAQKRAVFETLAGLGYARTPLVDGPLVMAQAAFVRTDDLGEDHTIDVHWRVANPHVFADVLTYDDLASRAATLDVRGQVLRVPTPVDALMLACVHRAAHHNLSGELLWLYDIHLLAARLAPAEWRVFIARAAHDGLRALCAEALDSADACFGTPVPAEAARPPSDVIERSAAYLRKDLRPIDRLAIDLSALPRGAGMRLLRQHLLPSPGFMRERYDVPHDVLLPVFYLRRLVVGASRWIARRPA